jgi:taurine--2-oxoglutarate transaminase
MFWALELVRDRVTREPLVPFNATGADAAPMNAFAAACKERGLFPFTHFNRTHVVPPCTTSESELHEGVAILDEALEVADRLLRGLTPSRRRRPGRGPAPSPVQRCVGRRAGPVRPSPSG